MTSSFSRDTFSRDFPLAKPPHMAELKPWADFSSLFFFFFLKLLGLKGSEHGGFFTESVTGKIKKKRTVSLGDTGGVKAS